jgi:hypothetical protein
MKNIVKVLRGWLMRVAGGKLFAGTFGGGVLVADVTQRLEYQPGLLSAGVTKVTSIIALWYR